MWEKTKCFGQKDSGQRNYRILVIEDDAQVRSTLCRILKCEGYDVDDAADGQAGIRRYREQPADLIVTDMILPKLSGSSVISRLWNEFPKLNVIAISGGGTVYGPAGYLNFARELGARKILSKPFKREELLAAVREALP